MSRTFDAAQIGVNETNLLTPPSSVYNNLNAWTLSAWVFPTANDPFAVIFVKDPQVSYNMYLVIDALVLFGHADYSTFASSFSIETISLNQWTHIAATYDNAGDKKVHLYIGGVEATYSEQTTASGVLSDNSANGWMFGNDTFDDGFTGNIAEQAIWNVALTGTQIADIAASTTGASAIQTANLVGYWHECGLASPEPDSSGNGNSAVLSVNPPLQGSNSPGYSLCGSPPPPSPYSVPDCRNYATFPNTSRDVNGTLIYDVQTSSNQTIPPTDSRAAGPPVACGTYPQNSRTPGTFGPGE